MAAPVVRNHAETILSEKQHLAVPGIGIQRPSVRKRDDWTLAPVLVVDCRAILYRNRAHIDFLLELVETEMPVVLIYLLGTNTGAPLPFTRNTTNFAGLVLLAFRPTT